MRKVPEFLPFDIRVECPSVNGLLPSAISKVRVPTRMEFVLYNSPSLIHGLLMTEVITAGDEIQRFFFGYKCTTCETVFLVPSQIRREEELWHYMQHPCDSSELRRAVKNARHFGLERDERIMEGMNGKWWTEKMDVDAYMPMPIQGFNGGKTIQEAIIYGKKEDLCATSGKPAGSAAVNFCLPKKIIQDSEQSIT